MSYPSEVYDQALGILEKRRSLAEQELEKRRSLLYARSPRAQQLERTIARTSAAAAKTVLAGGDVKSALEQLRDKNLALQKELADIIKGFGFPENYLDPWYTCPLCRDRGDIDGKMCGCMKKLLRRIAFDRLNASSPLELCDFDSFDLNYYPKTAPAEGRSPYDTMTLILKFCRRYADNFSLLSDSLLMQGGPGLGKTHLSLAIAREVIDKDFGVVYVSAPTLMSQLAKESFDYSSKNSGVSQALIDCDLLILDDLGTEFGTRFSTAAMYNMINSRMITSKPTIISTNLTMKELQESYGSRVTSRLIGGLKRLEFCGRDIRQLKRMKPLPTGDT